MIDKNVIKREPNDTWRPAMIIPHGFKAKIKQYRILNKNLLSENEKLEKEITENRLLGIEKHKVSCRELNLLNLKLSKLIKDRFIRVEGI